MVRLAFFTMAAGCAGFISAEATATTLSVLVILAACCRGSIRMELVFMGIAAFAARYSGGKIEGFKEGLYAVLPLIIALGGLFFMSRTIFGPRRERLDSWHRNKGADYENR